MLLNYLMETIFSRIVYWSEREKKKKNLE